MVGESSGGEPGGCGSLFGVCVCGWAFVRWVVLMLVLSAQSQGCNLVVAGRCVYASVFFSGSLGGESSPPKFHISPPKFEVVNDCYQNVQYTTTIFELFSPPTLLS